MSHPTTTVSIPAARAAATREPVRLTVQYDVEQPGHVLLTFDDQLYGSYSIPAVYLYQAIALTCQHLIGPRW